MISKSIRENKEGTIPSVQISQRETIQEVHIPCTFIVLNLQDYYTKNLGECNW